MRRSFFYFIEIFFFTFAIICEEGIKPLEVKSFFSEKEIERVLNGEIITRMSIKYNEWNENTDLKIDIPKTKYSNEDFSHYEMISDEKAFIPYNLNEKNKLDFLNILTSYSKLQGMKYYSRKADEVLELIINCYRVESEKNKKRISDEVYKTIPQETTSYFFQEDNRFGKLIFRSKLYNEGNNFVMINTCTQPITFVVFVNRREEFKFITYFIYDEEREGYFYYTVNPIRIRIDIALKKLSPTTFSNRLRATTVHLSKLLGLNWEDKYNPWDPDKMEKGEYRNY